jgi:diacylglycerol O-acyltransferase
VDHEELRSVSAFPRQLALHSEVFALSARHAVTNVCGERCRVLRGGGPNGARSRREVRRLARDYPLWECWIIEGLADDQWAILTKMHHCMADGIAAMQVLSVMADDGGGDTFATAIRASTEPSRPGIAMPRLTWNPLAWMQEAWHESTAVANAAGRAIDVAAGIVAGLVRPAAASSFIGSVTTMRRVSAARVSLDDVT